MEVKFKKDAADKANAAYEAAKARALKAGLDVEEVLKQEKAAKAEREADETELGATEELEEKTKTKELKAAAKKEAMKKAKTEAALKVAEKVKEERIA